MVAESRFAQRILIVPVCLRGAGYFRFQLLLFVLRVRQPLRVVVLPCIALLQLIAGLLKRALILPEPRPAEAEKYAEG